MSNIWGLFNGKKTTIAVIVYLANQAFRVANGEPIDPAETAASIMAILGLGHKVVKISRQGKQLGSK